MEFGFRYNKQVLGKLPPERLSPGKSAPTPNPNPGKNFLGASLSGRGGQFCEGKFSTHLINIVEELAHELSND